MSNRLALVAVFTVPLPMVTDTGTITVDITTTGIITPVEITTPAIITVTTERIHKPDISNSKLRYSANRCRSSAMRLKMRYWVRNEINPNKNPATAGFFIYRQTFSKAHIALFDVA